MGFAPMTYGLEGHRATNYAKTAYLYIRKNSLNVNAGERRRTQIANK